jgi:CubicO group peptidase (beta-lactamase class C family)
VIEKVSGKSYEEFVRSNIFDRCGILNMQLAGNTLAERAGGEVIYYEQTGGNPYGMNVRRMDSHGGWIGTPNDVVRFAMRVDGFNTTPNILSRKSIETMTTPPAESPGYASGWSVNKVPNWWHTGSLPGVFSILVRTASGLCWAAFANTRTSDINLDSMMWKMVKAVPAWRA